MASARSNEMPPSRRMRALGDYLRARRALIDPRDVGVFDGGRRRVVGLRREEVAAVAGISSEYYLRLEQGRDHQPSEPVVESLARALQLDAYGAEHLRGLAHGRRRRSPHPDRTLSESISALVGHLVGVGVVVLDRNQDVIFANEAASALSPWLRPGKNRLIALFTDGAHETTMERDATRRAAVAALRRDGVVEDPRFREIVGQLSMTSPAFSDLWARHDVGPLRGGVLDVNVTPFGRLELQWQPFSLPDRGQTVVTISGRPGSVESAALASLAISARRP